MTIERMTKLYKKIFEGQIFPSLEFILRKIDETRNYLLDQINHNDLMSEKCKKTCKYLNYVEDLLILVLTVTGCVTISAFAS